MKEATLGKRELFWFTVQKEQSITTWKAWRQHMYEAATHTAGADRKQRAYIESGLG